MMSRGVSPMSEEHVEAELREVLELALSGRVVDRHERVVDEARERGPVIAVVGDGRGIRASSAISFGRTPAAACCTRSSSDPRGPDGSRHQQTGHGGDTKNAESSHQWDPRLTESTPCVVLVSRRSRHLGYSSPWASAFIATPPLDMRFTAASCERGGNRTSGRRARSVHRNGSMRTRARTSGQRWRMARSWQMRAPDTPILTATSRCVHPLATIRAARSARSSAGRMLRRGAARAHTVGRERSRKVWVILSHASRSRSSLSPSWEKVPPLRRRSECPGHAGRA